MAEAGVSDGYWMPADGRLFLSALEENAVEVIEPSDQVRTVIRDDGLRWLDSFAQLPGPPFLLTRSQ